MPFHWYLLRPGPIWLDAGSMFGVVPRAVWSRSVSTDDRNRMKLAHNCLLLTDVESPSRKILIEAGSGDKFDAKWRDIFGLADTSISRELLKIDVNPVDIRDVIVSHLHFDHCGGLTQASQDRSSKHISAFPNAAIHVQRREWDDAIANNSVMTRTYLPENLEPIHHQLHLIDSPSTYRPGHIPARGEMPIASLESRMTNILPGIDVFLVPGHTWGQQAIRFIDDQNRTIVFTPDVLPTRNHIAASCSLAYDVEAYFSANTRGWFLNEAMENGWTLVLTHEPGDPVCRVERDDRGWYRWREWVVGGR